MEKDNHKKTAAQVPKKGSYQGNSFGGVDKHSLFYDFGGVKAYDLKEIENEILSESIYLDVFAGSDEARKKEIRPLIGTVERLKKLSGYRYNWIHGDASSDTKLGLMAQEVEKVFPTLVGTTTEGDKSVSYLQFIPVLVQAVKELDDQIQSLRQDNRLLRERLSSQGLQPIV